jgi:hypothetical protein
MGEASNVPAVARAQATHELPSWQSFSEKRRALEREALDFSDKTSGGLLAALEEAIDP